MQSTQHHSPSLLIKRATLFARYEIRSADRWTILRETRRVVCFLWLYMMQMQHISNLTQHPRIFFIKLIQINPNTYSRHFLYVTVSCSFDSKCIYIYISIFNCIRTPPCTFSFFWETLLSIYGKYIHILDIVCNILNKLDIKYLT